LGLTVPQFNLRISPNVPPLQPRRSERLLATVPSPFASAFAIPAQARQTQRHHRRFPGGQFNEATKFTSCYGPMSCSPDSGTDFYFRAFPSISHLIEESNITTWVNSQFPRPDFHRLDTQPYGLHTGLQDRQDMNLVNQNHISQPKATKIPRVLSQFRKLKT